MGLHPKDGEELRSEVAGLLGADGAHLAPAEILAKFPAGMRGRKPRGSAHTAWELLEHLRIAQRDILEWSFDPQSVSPPWPEGYWPKTSAPPDAKAWGRSVRAFLADLRSLVRIARSREHDLLAPIPHAPGVTLLHELFLVASHNSYHLGQIASLGRWARARAAARSLK